MSVEQVKKFLEEVAANEELQAKMAILPLGDPQEAIEQGIAIAKEAGYTIDDELAKNFLLGESRELCDIELDHVAGGVSAGANTKGQTENTA